MSGVLDLNMLRGDNDLAAGFSVSIGVYQTKVEDEDGDEVHIQLPVLDLNFFMANGKTQHRVSISPDMVLALVATTSNWKMSLDQAQQGAAPPAPPSGLA
jgi:hypothetical protein